MMREEVRVVAVNGDYAEVVGQRQSGCSGCHAKASCSMMGGNRSGEETRVWALNQAHAQVGEWVTLEISERQFLRASFLVYLMPLFFLFLAAAGVRTLMLPYGSEDMADGMAALAGLLAVALFFWWLRHHTHGPDAKGRFQPVIKKPDLVGNSFHCDDHCG
ncbi:MAG: SoxR reducing system RseC family protein [Magnetococcales bacterium]|nr:SoxR reducing system RseC family protein [Magnetococcales bacterium]NGZ25517.1 SoxR reducing system RseC family protein [Magnetococcales bacterium]